MCYILVSHFPQKQSKHMGGGLFHRLMQLLHSCYLNLSRPECHICKLNNKGSFTVQSLYSSVVSQDLSLVHSTSRKPSLHPPNESSSAGLLLKERCPPLICCLDGVIGPTLPTICFLCLGNEETTDCVFLHLTSGPVYLGPGDLLV